MRIDRDLNALITHAIGLARHLIVDEQVDEITPCFICQTKQGMLIVYACEWPDRQAKYQSLQAFRAHFQDEGYERYVFVGEAWKGSAEDTNLPPSERKSRQEIVFIMAGDDHGALELATIPIERDANNTRSLGEVDGPADVADANAGGLMGNLLTEPPDLSRLQARA